MSSSSVIDLAREKVLRHFRWIDGDADTWTMLAHGDSLSAIVGGLARLAGQERPDVVVGIESRGFVLGAAVAVKLGVGFVPIRKDGSKFPGDVIEQGTKADYRGREWTLSTRKDLIQPGQRVVLVDDWIETGSQALAAAALLASCGAALTAAVVIIDEASDVARNELPPIKALVHARELP